MKTRAASLMENPRLLMLSLAADYPISGTPLMKKPVGRSAPLGWYGCDDSCDGYRHEPFPGSLWAGERSDDFGYPIGVDGTVPIEQAIERGEG